MLEVELETRVGRINITEDTPVVQRSECYEPPSSHWSKTIKPYGVGDIHGIIAVVFARCEQDAMDDVADEGLLDGRLIPQEELPDYGEEEEGVWRLGGASEPFRDEGLWIVDLPNPEFSYFALLAAHLEKQKNVSD